MFGIAGSADVQDIEFGVPLLDRGERPRKGGGQRFMGEIGGEEHLLQLQLGPCARSAGSDDQHRTANRVEDLLGNGAEDQSGKTAAAMRADHQHVDPMVLHKAVDDFGNLALLDPALEFHAVEQVGARESRHILIAVTAGGLVDRGHHFGNIREFGGKNQMQQMQSRVEVTRDGECMLNRVFRARTKVGGDRYVVNRHGGKLLDCHIQSPSRGKGRRNRALCPGVSDSYRSRKLQRVRAAVRALVLLPLVSLRGGAGLPRRATRAAWSSAEWAWPAEPAEPQPDADAHACDALPLWQYRPLSAASDSGNAARRS